MHCLKLENGRVPSKHFRLTKSVTKDREGPFVEVENRLHRSPYLRSVLEALGRVVLNVALMSVKPGGEVEAHFDTSAYWEPRVRVHIPTRTQKRRPCSSVARWVTCTTLT